VLNPPAAFDARPPLIILPHDPEADDPIGFDDPAQDFVLTIGLRLLNQGPDLGYHVVDRLQELRLSGVAVGEVRQEAFQVGGRSRRHDEALLKTRNQKTGKSGA